MEVVWTALNPPQTFVLNPSSGEKPAGVKNNPVRSLSRAFYLTVTSNDFLELEEVVCGTNNPNYPVANSLFYHKHIVLTKNLVHPIAYLG